MKILLLTHAFYPHIGGLETVARVLAESFMIRGHEVRVVTQSPSVVHGLDAAAPGAPRFPFRVYRRPSPWRLLELTRWCDVFFQNNISLHTLWPQLFIQRPWVIAHQTWLTRVDGSEGWQDWLKLFLIRFGSPVAISHAVAAPLPVRAEVIGNPYKADLFGPRPDVPRDKPLAFLGRLVSDKGVDLLFEALGILRREASLIPEVTIIGDGPERANLEAQAARLGIAPQIRFIGQRTGEELVRTLNQHRVLVTPSRLAEPFGVVALEGIACGCVVVGSQEGGLCDAIGECGLLFPNHDAHALADALCRVLIDDELCRQLRARAGQHLRRFRPLRIADTYLRLFERVVRRDRPDAARALAGS